MSEGMPHLPEIERRCEKATPGPWGARQLSGGNRHEAVLYYPYPFEAGTEGRCIQMPLSDADFVSNARKDIPDLLAYTKQLLRALGIASEEHLRASTDTGEIDWVDIMETVDRWILEAKKEGK